MRARRIVWGSLLVIVGVVVILLAPKAVVEAKWLTRADSMRGCLVHTSDLRRTERCLRAEQRETIRDQGLARGLTALEVEAAGDRRVQAYCHNTMHTVGRTMEVRGLEASQLPDSFSDGVSWGGQCTSGFLHGYMQGAGREPGRGEDLVAASLRTCSAMPIVNRNECIHALGHGLARTERNRMDPSLAWCSRLPDDLRTECGSGVVMELQLARDQRYREAGSDGDLGPPRRFDCASLAEPYGGTCLAREIVAASMLPDSRSPGALADDACGPADGAARTTCYQALGFLFADPYGRTKDPRDGATRACTNLAGADAAACAYGSGLKWTYHGRIDADAAVRRCSAWLPRQLAACVEGAARGHGAHLDAPAPARVCQDFPAVHARACARGATASARTPGLS